MAYKNPKGQLPKRNILDAAKKPVDVKKPLPGLTQRSGRKSLLTQGVF